VKSPKQQLNTHVASFGTVQDRRLKIHEALGQTSQMTLAK
jgi:hypothetical protein